MGMRLPCAWRSPLLPSTAARVSARGRRWLPHCPHQVNHPCPRSYPERRTSALRGTPGSMSFGGTMATMNEVRPLAFTTVPDMLHAARDAIEQHRWSDAFDLFTQADAQGGLSGADLQAFGLTAFFMARADIELDIHERAFKAYEAEGQPVRAAVVALNIARSYGFAGKHSIASAWTRRAERILGPDGDGYAYGYLALVRSETASATGDIETALTLAQKAVDIGTRAADADLTAYALSNLGSLKIATGNTTDGF